MPQLFLPSNSSVDMYCRAVDNESLSFAVNLGSDASNLQMRTDIVRENQILRMHGVYKLDNVIETPGMPPILRLRINNTSVNNGTEVICVNNGPTTRLSIYGN